MNRRLFTLLTAISLAICVATCVLWVRSFHVADWVVFIHRHAPMRTSSAGVATWNGAFSLEVALTGSTDYGDPRNTLWQCNPKPARSPIILPFDRSAERWLWFGGTWKHFTLILPAWAIALVSGAVSALCWQRVRKVRLAERTGLCPSCGYDLRATTGRCPECGQVPNNSQIST